MDKVELRSLSFAFKVRPLARLDEARPVERMPATLAFEHLQLYMSQPIAATLATLQRLVVLDHQVPRAAIRDRPQTHHLRLRSRQRQRAPQSEDPFAILHLAYTSVAGREHDQLRPPQIQPRGFSGRQDAVLPLIRQDAARGESRPEGGRPAWLRFRAGPGAAGARDQLELVSFVILLIELHTMGFGV